MNMKRIEFDDLFLQISDLISQRSVCLKNKVGAVVVKDNRIISIGYNGMLPGFKHCEDYKDCPRWSLKSGEKYEVGDCQHAEMNAILFCAKNGVSTKDTTLYVNNSVCRMCAKAIIMAGIKRVVCLKSDYDGNELLKKAGVEVLVVER